MKKQITLKQAHDLLQISPVIGLEGRYIVPSLFELEGEEGSEFCVLYWTEIYKEDPVDFTVVFEEGDNKKCELDGCELVLVNNEGEEEVLQLLVPHYPEFD
jgi:hypothetical protein